MTVSRSVPVVILAGYLGSGKTTLLNHLLRTAGGTRIGVVVNDFGAVNVDSLLVAGATDSTVSLGNGCLCCAIGDDGLDGALTQLMRPSAGIDVVVVEASGIAEPRVLVAMASHLDDPRLRYGGLVYVVDAASIDDLRARHPEVDDHLALADLVVVNKTDLVDDAARERITAMVRAENADAPIVGTRAAAVDPGLLFDAVEAVADEDTGPRQLALDELLTDAAGHDHGDHGHGNHDVHGHDDHGHDDQDHGDHDHDHGHAHLHDGYQSAEIDTAAPMDPRLLAAFLERPPHGCYRIKGIVHFAATGPRQKFVVHAVGGFVRVTRQSWRGDPPRSTLVAIGAGLDVARANADLRAAVDTSGSGDADEHGILRMLRYLPESAT